MTRFNNYKNKAGKGIFILSLMMICFTGLAQRVEISYDESGNRISMVQPGRPKITVTPDSLFFNYEDSSAYVVVDRSNEFFLEWYAAADHDWVTVDTSSGEEKDTLFFRVHTNTTREIRKSFLRVIDKDSSVLPFKVYLEQEAGPNIPPVVVAPSPDLNFISGFSNFEVDLSPIFADANDDPLTYESTFTVDDVVAVSISEEGIATITEVNPGTTGWVIIADDGYGGEARDTVMIDVSDDAILALSRDSLYVSALTRDTSIIVLNNGIKDMVWNAKPEVTWIKVTNDVGVNNTQMHIELEENRELDLRVGQVVITADGARESPQTLTIYQEGRINLVPEATTAFEDMEKEVGFLPVELDLSAYFSDPDPEDNLSYYASSSHVPVATTQVDGSLLKLIGGLNSGQTTITVGALDQRDTVVTTFSLVARVIQDPVLNLSTDSINIDANAQSAEIEIFNRGLDDMPWIIQANNTWTSFSKDEDTNDAVVEVYFEKNPSLEERIGLISVNANGARNNPGRIWVRQSGRINNPPVLDQEIPEQLLGKKDGPTEIDLSEYFSDPDEEDQLRFIAQESNSGIVVPTITGSVLSLQPSSVRTGPATVEVTAFDLKDSISYKFLVEVNTVVSLEDDILNEEGILIYPNPANDRVTIDLSKGPLVRPDIGILNANGVIITEVERVENKVITFDLSHLQPGIYTVMIKSNKGKVARKIIVQRE